MRKIGSPHVFIAEEARFDPRVLTVNKDGRIMSIEHFDLSNTAGIELYEGAIVPGFINAHCHLELSHMRDVAPTGIGLIPFITRVMQHRESPANVISDAIAQADQAMYDAGIQAVGDICNKMDTSQTKASSPIHYYSFVEFFDLMQPGMTDQSYAQYAAVYDGMDDSGHNKKSAVPHAPYSVTPGLFERLRHLNKCDDTISIHNQELSAENELFESKSGAFVDFYNSIAADLSAFRPSGKRSIQYAMEHMSAKHKTLYVHNTMTNADDIQSAQDWSKNVYWCTCPNANLYIENKLPDYQSFTNLDAQMCIGTDSIMSNWQLSILDEIKTIHRYQSYLEVNRLLQWATINGARALSYDDMLGSFAVGKSPGILHLHSSRFDLSNPKDWEVSRLV